MNINNNTATIMTSSGQFYKVIIKKYTPKIGETFSGKVKYNNILFYKVASIVALLLIVFAGSSAYAYYTPTTTAVININPSIQIKSNRFDKIIELKALNKDGEKILNEVNIQNKDLNDGLKLIIIQSKKDNFINKNYTVNGKIITLKLVSKNNKMVDLYSFENYIFDCGLSMKVDNSGLKEEIKSKKYNKKDANSITKEKSSSKNSSNNSNVNPNNVTNNKTNPKLLDTTNQSNNNSDTNYNKDSSITNNKINQNTNKISNNANTSNSIENSNRKKNNLDDHSNKSNSKN